MSYCRIIRGLVFGLWAAAVSMSPAYASDSKEYHITIGGLERSYLQHRPARLNAKIPASLVIVLHGGFGTGSQAEKSYGWDAVADGAGFIVAYPDGVGRTWNAGGCCGEAVKKHLDDIGFVTGIIHDIAQRENIDPARVYLTGISNGAALSYRYACEGSYAIAAIGTVAGNLAMPCANPHPISVMEIHGVDDHNIPLSGGEGSKGVSKFAWTSVQQTIDIFAHASNCQPATLHKEGPINSLVSQCPEGREVSLITIDGAGHQWPGGRKTPLASLVLPMDPPSNAMNATSVLWEFFQKQHAQP